MTDFEWHPIGTRKLLNTVPKPKPDMTLDEVLLMLDKLHKWHLDKYNAERATYEDEAAKDCDCFAGAEDACVYILCPRK